MLHTEQKTTRKKPKEFIHTYAPWLSSLHLCSSETTVVFSTLHSVHVFSTLHSVHCIQYIAFNILQSVYCSQYIAVSILHSVHCIQCIAFSTLNFCVIICLSAHVKKRYFLLCHETLVTETKRNTMPQMSKTIAERQ